MTPAAVFDTVVLLQAGGKPFGPAGACLRLVMEDRLALYLSREGLAELEDVLGRDSTRRRFPLLTPEHVGTFVRGLRSKARVIAEVPAVFSYDRDPDDEHILNLVVATGVRFLVTRDKDILDLMKDTNPDGMAFRHYCPGLTILDPVALLASLKVQSE